jgi:hypothetical protein
MEGDFPIPVGEEELEADVSGALPGFATRERGGEDGCMSTMWEDNHDLKVVTA